jgi:hypothetical protein
LLKGEYAAGDRVVVDARDGALTFETAVAEPVVA